MKRSSRHCSCIIFPGVSSVSRYLSACTRPPFGTCIVYLAVQSCRTEPCWEQKVTWHMWNLCFVYPSSSMSTSLWCYPPALSFRPLETENTSPEHKLWMLWVCLALLPIGLPFFEFLLFSFGWYFARVATGSPSSCDVIFVKQVFQSQEKESENVCLCLNGQFPLIPWLSCPLLWSQCKVVHAQILHQKVTFVWLAGSPPQRTNPAELVHSAPTSWPEGIGH